MPQDPNEEAMEQTERDEERERWMHQQEQAFLDSASD